MTFDPNKKLNQVKASWILKSLNYHEWNKTETAKSLGVSVKTIYNFIDKYGLREPRKKWDLK